MLNYARIKEFFLQHIVLRLLSERRQKAELKAIHRVAIWQFGGIGDMIIGAAVARDVMRRFPEAEIDVYCSNPDASAFIKELGPQLHGIYPYDVYAIDSKSMLGRGARRYFREVLQQHRQNRYDLLINLHLPKLIDWWLFEILLMRKSGAGFVAGFVPPAVRSKLLDRQLACEVVSSRHYLDLYGELLAPLGIEVGSRGYFPITRKEGKRKLAVLHPGASKLFKRWPVENFIEIAKRLSRQGWSLAIVGDQDEKGLGVALEKAIPQATNTAGTLGLQEMANLLAGAQLFIGNDSAPFHLAVAAGVDAVGIFGAGPAMYSDYSASNVRVVRIPLFCAPCFKNECAYRMECMTQLPVELVWSAACELMGQDSQT